jgi:hypothetical protein
MTKATVERSVFGAKPSIASLPKIDGLKSDVDVAAAIGAIGGGLQRTICSTAFFYGAMAKEAGEVSYNYGKPWEGYYKERYADKPLTPASKKNAKKETIIYATFAFQMEWDADDVQEMAGRVFDHPFGSLGQKAAMLKKLLEEHKDEMPEDSVIEKMLPKQKAKPKKQPVTLKVKASNAFTALDSITSDDDYEHLRDEIAANDELQAAYTAAREAVDAFAKLVIKLAKEAKDGGVKPTETETATKEAAIAAQAKAGRGKGKPLHS